MGEYDIFISYRREGGYDTAKHLFDLLTRDGYRVSFDIDTLRNGFFDKELLKRVDECRDFLLIVDNHCFDRTISKSCKPDSDWLRQELAYALTKNKNIIPIFLHGVADFPDNLPPDISKVIRRNGPHIIREYFDDFYSKLKSRYLETPPPRIEQNNVTKDQQIKEVKMIFMSNLPCSIFANGAACCNIYDSLSATKYIYPGQYEFTCISRGDSSNVKKIKYVVRDVTCPQYVKIEFEPSAADLGVTQEQYNEYKRLRPGYSINVDRKQIIYTIESHREDEQREKKQKAKESAKQSFLAIGILSLVTLAIFMLCNGVSYTIVVCICAIIAGVGAKIFGLED